MLAILAADEADEGVAVVAGGADLGGVERAALSQQSREAAGLGLKLGRRLDGVVVGVGVAHAGQIDQFPRLGQHRHHVDGEVRS